VLNVEISRPDLYPDSALIGASALLGQSRAREAAKLIEACLVARPVWPEAKLLVGNAHFALGKIPQAIAAFESALADRPGWDQAQAALQRARAAGAR
jgi:tetratricopeptide (TPR) repeat protein